MDISLGTMDISIIYVSSLGGGLHDMMHVSKSTLFDGLCNEIHFCFIQFLLSIEEDLFSFLF